MLVIITQSHDRLSNTFDTSDNNKTEEIKQYINKELSNNDIYKHVTEFDIQTKKLEEQLMSQQKYSRKKSFIREKIMDRYEYILPYKQEVKMIEMDLLMKYILNNYDIRSKYTYMINPLTEVVIYEIKHND